MGVVNEVSCGMRVEEADKRFPANFYTLAFGGLVIESPIVPINQYQYDVRTLLQGLLTSFR
ncbi:hypothetical protein M3216_29945 [Paenibacillus macerans]|nr:hypothetical protein [Paenibacillus macerans]